MSAHPMLQPPEEDTALAATIQRIWDEAQAVGLRPFPTHFEIVPSSIMYEIGSYLMPGRFSHWTHGKMYQMQKTMYDYGLSKIYELVINTNPCWAFLLESNTPIQNKLVVAHVLAHSDFFANNAYFANTSRRMLDTVNLNAQRIRGYEFQYGRAEVEQLLDAVLSIQEHVDPYTADIPPDPEEEEPAPSSYERPYDDLWRLDHEEQPPDTEKSKPQTPNPLTPREPDRDLLRFIGAHSPILADWERNVIDIVRGEMLYFFPQMQTKIVNEGWATLLHATILHRLNLSHDEYLDFADLHAGVVQPNPRRLNPYYVGYRVLQDINRRTGGDDETISDALFELRETASDVSLMRNELTKELVDDLDLYLYQRVGDELVITDKDWTSVRDRLVSDLTSYGFPVIEAVDGDYEGHRELFLQHVWTGRPLDLAYARKALEHIYRLWGRKVWLASETPEEKPLLLSYDRRSGHNPPP